MTWKATSHIGCTSIQRVFLQTMCMKKLSKSVKKAGPSYSNLNRMSLFITNENKRNFINVNYRYH